MIHLIKILSFLFVSQVCLSQPSISEANKLRQEGKLEAAIIAYKNDYKTTPTDWKNTYNLACVYALTAQKDSAYHYLDIALKDDTSLWALADSDLYALIDDPRWAEVENRQIERFQKYNGKLKESEVAKKWLNIILKDQALDYYIGQAKAHFMKEGSAPQWYYPLGMFKQQIIKDNYERMQQLINDNGWPKYSSVGELAADAPLLVINHHESNEVRKKYIAQIKQSCLEGEGSCMEYAKVQDRILVDENQLQIYGMQFRYNAQRNLEPFPIKDPEYVDQRRKEIGLVPLKDYLKRKINYDWTVEQE
ncbi:MAG: hypothetical protein JKY22_06390 [Flavobacteriaceae bacterium]|nr:hypothetical protein [Flavobacteriaceae bacterium]